MPLQAEVLKAFNFDLESEEKWPLLKEMTKNFGYALWVENTDLYYLVLVEDEKRIESKRLEFYQTFLPVIKKTIRYTNKFNTGGINYRSLLHFAFKIDDVQVIQIILDCLLLNINTNIEDPLTQRIYHPSYYINNNDILFLAKNYPQQFIYFISNIKLVKSSGILNKSVSRVQIFSSSRIIVDSYEINYKSDMWNILYKQYKNKLRFPELRDIRNLFKQSSSDNVNRPVTSQYLPLKNAASRELLNEYYNISLNEKLFDIFDGDVGKIILIYLWKRQFTVHMIQFFFFIVYVAIYSYSIFMFEYLVYEPEIRKTNAIWVLEYSILVATIFNFLVQLYQVYFEHIDITNMRSKSNNKKNNIVCSKDKNNFLLYFRWVLLNIIKYIWIVIRDFVYHFFLTNIWNFNDLLVAVFVITGTSLRILNYDPLSTSTTKYPTLKPSQIPTMDHSGYKSNYPTYLATETIHMEEKTGRIILAIATICVYFKVLYFLRPFPSFGPVGKLLILIVIVVIIYYYHHI